MKDCETTSPVRAAADRLVWRRHVRVPVLMLAAGLLSALGGLTRIDAQSVGDMAKSSSATTTSALQFGSRAQAIYNWLAGQTVDNTGLVESFDPSQDRCLLEQASTYDQAIAGIAMCLLGDCAASRRILQFFETTWRTAGAFANFYSATNGRVGLEYRVHAGPNLWVALLALNHERLTGETRFRRLAIEIARWASGLPHHRGGIAMSDRDDARDQWTRIVSTENVLDYVSVLKSLRARVGGADRTWIDRELEASKQYLTGVAFDASTGDMRVGYSAESRTVNPWGAADTYSWAVTGIGPATLAAWGIDPGRLLNRLATRFRVRVADAEGIDFMDDTGARQFRKPFVRMISPEWTGQAIVAYRSVAEHLLQRSRNSQDSFAVAARRYVTTADELTRHLDRLAVSYADGRVSYPYASAADVFAFMAEWRTPKAGIERPLVGSIAGSAWVVFANLGYDPMTPFSQGSAAAPRVSARRSPRRIPDGWLRASSTCNSAGLVDAAWINLDSSRLAVADSFAELTVRLHRDSALAAQARKAAAGGKIIYNVGDAVGRHRLFAYAVLNDVGAALYIRGQVALRQGRPSLAGAPYRALVDSFTLAQVWDPSKDIFWTPATAVMREYAALAGLAHRTPAQRLASGEAAYVYRTFDAPENLWVGSGWMGDIASLSFAEIAAQDGDSLTSIRLTYAPLRRGGEGFAGITFQFPENNWGTAAGRDVRGGARLVLDVRGARGGESAEFLVGGVKGARVIDSIRWARTSGVVVVGREWQEVSIDCRGLDMSNVIAGVTWLTNRLRSPTKTTIYVRNIRFEPR